MPAVRRGAAPSFTAVRRGSIVIKEIRRGTVLKWSGAPIHDGFDWDGFLQGWLNEICDGTDPGELISDGIGGLIDGLGNEVGQLVNFVQGGINQLGTLVAVTGTNLVDAYCGAWGGTAPPDGLIGLVNGIPIVGDWIADWLNSSLDIETLIGSIPIIGNLAKQLGLLPDQLTGLVLEPLNYVVDELGNVLGTITCGKYTSLGDITENICYVIGISGQSAKMLIPDGLMSLGTQTSRMRYPTLAPADDGWLETQINELGDPGFSTQVFRRYANDNSGARGVGLDFTDGVASIVRRVGGTDTLVLPGLTSYGPGDVFRLLQVGNTHSLFKNGYPLQPWNDSTGTAASGAANRSVAMVMQGAKEMLGARRFSPSLNYVNAG